MIEDCRDSNLQIPLPCKYEVYYVVHSHLQILAQKPNKNVQSSWRPMWRIKKTFGEVKSINTFAGATVRQFEDIMSFSPRIVGKVVGTGVTTIAGMDTGCDPSVLLPSFAVDLRALSFSRSFRMRRSMSSSPSAPKPQNERQQQPATLFEEWYSSAFAVLNIHHELQALHPTRQHDPHNRPKQSILIGT